MKYLSTLAVVVAVNAFAPAGVAQATDSSSSGGYVPPVPRPPWPAGDERGMGNTQGPGTRVRCAEFLGNPRSREYELSHPRSETMPQSPFAIALDYEFRPTFGPTYTRHAVNGETITGEPGQQGTQMDALGHFAVLPKVWDPNSGPIPSQSAIYYSGYTQSQVKPTPDSPLLRLGIEKAAPIVTTAVLLDARRYLGGGRPLAAGQRITAADVQGMLNAQGLGQRGLLAGDVLYIYTGWQDNWRDPDTTGVYYNQGPGIAPDVAIMLREKAVVAIGMDVPFIDPVAPGQIAGGMPPGGQPRDLPYFAHYYLLTQAGIHLLEDLVLGQMAADKTWLSCTMVLPLRERGGAGSAIRPMSYGPPNP